MRVLVTGAAGFIGSSLCEALLAQGEEVRGVDSFSDYYSRELKEKNLTSLRAHDAFSLIEDDLTLADLEGLLDGVEAVFHLAAQPGVRASWGQEFKVYTDANILATQRLLEACRGRELKRFVFASSSSVYGDTPDLPAQESSLLAPVSPYGVSKAAGEQLCNLYQANFGLPCVSLRYFTVYGPRQRPDMAFHRFLKAIAQGAPIRLFGDGSQSRDFTYIDDIVAGTLAALAGRPGQTYNLGGGHRLELAAVIRLMGEIAGRTVEIRYEPTVKGDVRHTAAKITKAQQDLG
ncbi:MAG: NAD-dependent epimerase/dehydratase family protein, partial [Deltaproteobacteria bacterium]|nr:NAD-dependent epimerase/dehydratase family protein [Deltaproteobacteria bacterium]